MTTAEIKDREDELDEHTKPPFLRRVRIRNYKSIAFCDVALEPLTVLVGRNGSGKSNFLNALAFLRDAVVLNPTEAIRKHGGNNAIICQSAKKSETSIEVEVGLFDNSEFVAKYGITMPFVNHTTVPELREYFQLSNKSKQYEFRAANGKAEWAGQPFDGQKFSYPSNYLFLSRLSELPIIDFCDSLRTFGIYNFQPDNIRVLQIPSLGSTLLRDGKNLASVVQALKEMEPEIFIRLQQYMSFIVPEISEFRKISYGEYETIQFDMRGPNTHSKLVFDAVNMSDGTLRALAALIAAFQIDIQSGHPSVVGIEEPETSLHPGAMRALMDAFREATERTQVLITTHSPDMLADPYLKLNQILVVRNRNGQTEIGPLNAGSREIIEKELYSVADLQRMDHLEPAISHSATNGALNGNQEC